MIADSTNTQARIVLSWYQAKPLLAHRTALPTTVDISLDLGLTTIQLPLTVKGLNLPGDHFLTWNAIEEISGANNSCFIIEDDKPVKIQNFSEHFNRLYSLMPTEGAPTMLISGIPMHRIKGIEPYKDTLTKISTLKPVNGLVLDTSLGLGYTAIELAQQAELVITIELDPTVVEICHINPWSKALFSNPRIQLLIGDSFDQVDRFESNSFSRILHDPPTFSLAGDLYSSSYYRKLYRILKSRGKMFHYIGDPKSRSGRGVSRGVKQRLYEAGFRRVTPKDRAYGLLAYK